MIPKRTLIIVLIVEAVLVVELILAIFQLISPIQMVCVPAHIHLKSSKYRILLELNVPRSPLAIKQVYYVER